MALELRPGHLLDQFLEGADSAGQRDESVGAIEHRLLAFVHVADHDQVVGGGQRMLLANKEVRDDPGHVAARGERRAGETAHEAIATAAIDESDALGREGSAQGLRRFREPRVIARARSAIDADIPNCAHVLSLKADLRAVGKGRQADGVPNAARNGRRLKEGRRKRAELR